MSSRDSMFLLHKIRYKRCQGLSACDSVHAEQVLGHSVIAPLTDLCPLRTVSHQAALLSHLVQDCLFFWAVAGLSQCCHMISSQQKMPRTKPKVFHMQIRGSVCWANLQINSSPTPKSWGFQLLWPSLHLPPLPVTDGLRKNTQGKKDAQTFISQYLHKLKNCRSSAPCKRQESFAGELAAIWFLNSLRAWIIRAWIELRAWIVTWITWIAWIVINSKSLNSYLMFPSPVVSLEAL